MKLYFTIKRLDRISDLTADDSNPLTKQEFDFDPAPKTLRELLTQLVKHNVLEYEKKIPELPNGSTLTFIRLAFLAGSYF